MTKNEINKKVKEVAGPEDCWDGYRKDGTKPGTGKNAGKRVNNCVKVEDVNEGLGDLAAIAERDHEVQMARADLYKLAKYAIKLHDMLKSVSEAEGIEGWKQAKITTAADDISSVYHAMDYDMKFAESKTTKNVMSREKTVSETDYAASLKGRVAAKFK
jgi:hypothetical protein|tara:strand:+ start:483 stop:959 length:477 start_codon:yes stop_codon:yes gene_type:complete